MNKQILSNLKDYLSESRNILITTHRGPDGDAMGSSLALYQLLVAQGHKVSVVVPNDYAAFLHWLPCDDIVVEYEKETAKAQELIKAASIIFCLDFNDLKRTDMMAAALDAAEAKMVMIDHHQEPTDFADFTFSVPTACSTAQLIYEFAEGMDWEHLMTKDIAACIYTGLVTDTGSFRFSSVEAKTHRITSELIDLGLQHAEIHAKLFDNNKASRLQLLGYCLSEKLEVLPEYHTAIMSLSTEELERFNFVKGDTEGFVNYALSIKGVIFTAFFIQHKDMVKISFRSKNNFRANEVSKAHFNGGGHINAAGGAFEGSLEDAISKFKNNLNSYEKELLIEAAKS